MLIRIKPLDAENVKEVFIPQERIMAIQTHDYRGKLSYVINADECNYVVDREAYERIVNEFMVLDTETGTLKWNFFDDKDVN